MRRLSSRPKHSAVRDFLSGFAIIALVLGVISEKTPDVRASVLATRIQNKSAYLQLLNPHTFGTPLSGVPRDASKVAGPAYPVRSAYYRPVRDSNQLTQSNMAKLEMMEGQGKFSQYFLMSFLALMFAFISAVVGHGVRHLYNVMIGRSRSIY